MSENKPRFYGTDYGKIIQAIALAYCYDFWEIQAHTGIENNRLYELIGQLMNEDRIYQWENQFRVNKELYFEWKKYYDKSFDDGVNEEITSVKKEQLNVLKWIQRWIEFKREYYEVDIQIHNNHFYLDTYLLNDFLLGLIQQTEKKLRVTSPWVENVSLTQLLQKISQNGRHVTLITRSPKLDSKFEYELSRAKEYAKCHKSLKECGVQVCYNDELHGKVIIVDKDVAVISSVNLQKNPASGMTWESGIITFEKAIVNQIYDSFDNIKVIKRKR